MGGEMVLDHHEPPWMANAHCLVGLEVVNVVKWGGGGGGGGEWGGVGWWRVSLTNRAAPGEVRPTRRGTRALGTIRPWWRR